jgi:AraC-like DNA-binding protein
MKTHNDYSHGMVSTVTITQATAATFFDLFISQTFLCFIRSGTKRVVCPINGEMIAKAGDLFIFPPGSIVTLENRPLLDADYRADGVYFSRDLIEMAFGGHPQPSSSVIQIVREAPNNPLEILRLIHETLGNPDLPDPIRRHRLIEPLIWLRHHGVHLQIKDHTDPLAKLRRLIETNPGHRWRVSEVAGSFAMSEATFRRWLAKSGHGFSKIVLSARLEKGLTLLQTTDLQISQIALECGFSTPSHFADSFKKRFGIKPMAIRSAHN